MILTCLIISLSEVYHGPLQPGDDLQVNSTSPKLNLRLPVRIARRRRLTPSGVRIDGRGDLPAVATVESLHDFQQMDLVGLCKPPFAQPMV
jgi:hypothetical protein